jgi:hypothetical protein
MSVTSILVTLAVIAAVGAVVVTVLKAKFAGRAGQMARKFKAKAILTPNELEFLARLESAVPEFRFLAQVAMGALLDPAVPRSAAREYYRLRGMFSQKIVDFVAQNRENGAIVAIIELDDRTHSADKDSQRDAMLTSAGYRVIRWASKAKPEAATIRAELLATPPAPGSASNIATTR